MSELVCLELSAVLWIAHVLIQAAAGNLALPAGYLFTPRDTPATAKGVTFGRASRALANYVENIVPFVALDLGLIVTHREGGIWPTLWVLARIAYIPLYLFGVTYARSAAWGLGLVAVIAMLVKLAF